MAGTALSVALMVPLAIPGYMIGSWRWLRGMQSTAEIGLIMFAFFMVWYVVLRMDGGAQVLVPIAMLVTVGGFGLGDHAWRRRRRRRKSS